MVLYLSQTHPISSSSSLPFSPHISLSTGRRIRISLPSDPSLLLSKTNSKRTNHLRQKLLKTPTTKPNLSVLSPQTLQSPDPRNDAIETPTNPFKRAEGVEQRQEYRIHEMFSPLPAAPKAFRFGSPKLFTNLVFCLLGLFILETLYNIWIMGPADTGGNSGGGVETGDMETNGCWGFNGDEAEFEKKLTEIRVLAREAREIEQRRTRSEASAPSSSVVGDDGDDVNGDRIDVRKEVNRRLLKLQKRRGKPLQAPNSDDKDGNIASRGELPITSLKDGIDIDGFKGSKNDTNRSSRVESDENGLLDRGKQRADGVNADSMEEEVSHWSSDELLRRIVLKVRVNEEAGREPYSGLDSEEMNFFLALMQRFRRKGPDYAKQWLEKRIEGIDLSNGFSERSGHEKPLEESVRSYEKIKSVGQIKTSSITDKLIERSEDGNRSSFSSIDNTSHGQEDFQSEPSSAEDSLHGGSNASEIPEGIGNQNEDSFNEIKSRELRSNFSQHSKNVNQGTLSISGANILSDSNGSSIPQLQSRKVEQSILHEVKDNQSDHENNLWWLDLPYVVAILLCKGSEHEGSEGFFSLKMNSRSGNGDYSCTIAFEDRGDANNFCYLLESYFEGLGGFKADAVPLSTKDLEEGVKSKGAKVLVVRKGQIKLYAGQPLADVERSLRSILK